MKCWCLRYICWGLKTLAINHHHYQDVLPMVSGTLDALRSSLESLAIHSKGGLADPHVATAVCDAIAQCKSLHVLDLSGCMNIEVSVLARSFRQLGCPGQLQSLSLNGCGLVSDLADLCQSLETCSLQALYLHENRLGSPAVASIASLVAHSLAGSLQTLDLSHNPLRSEGISQLAVSLRHCQSQLKTLIISQCLLDDECLVELGQYLQSPHVALATLDLGRNSFPEAGFCFLASALAANYTLLRLDLSHSHLSSANAVHLGHLVGSNAFLLELNLKSSTLEGDLEPLFTALGTNATLEELSIVSLSTPDQLVESFQKTLRCNSILMEAGNSVFGNLDLAAAFSRNYALKKKRQRVVPELIALGRTLLMFALPLELFLQITASIDLMVLSAEASRLAAYTIGLVLTTKSTLSELRPALAALPDGLDGYHSLIRAYARGFGDTPANIQKRVNYKPLSFYETMITLNESPMNVSVLDEFKADVQATNSDAFYYLTVYPDSLLTDASLATFSSEMAKMTSQGMKVMIRFAPEMNGNWFYYGQQPTVYKSEWKKMVSAVRQATSSNSDKIAFVWSPNTGMGYPFPFNSDPVVPKDKTADTNGDGVLTGADDPYSPYYPGDDWVDWVGMSIYSYGPDSGVAVNAPAFPGKLENYMNGYLNGNTKTPYNFYAMFSGTGSAVSSVTKGGKPYFLSETGAAVMSEQCSAVDGVGACLPNATWTVVPGSDAQSAADIHSTWWRQFINETFLKTYPQFKAAAFFEITKIEGNTVRDFASLGISQPDFISPLGKQVQAEDGLTLQTFQKDMAGPLGGLIKWANPSGSGSTGNGSTTGTGSTAGTGSPNTTTGSKSSADRIGVSLLGALVLGLCFY
ncbi:hypothetical protein HDU91_001178 [Kappamyces sp. JEL0680]|nr:hypothetical protein HDU91_001178 [Kappamyces sp. JEL0680]